MIPSIRKLVNKLASNLSQLLPFRLASPSNRFRSLLFDNHSLNQTVDIALNFAGTLSIVINVC
jgi:hypothetical protein